MWDPGVQLQEHAERYASAYGTDPYTAAWSWAEAIVTWREGWPGGTWRRRENIEGEDRDLVVAGVAEAIRLMTGSRIAQPIGDVSLSLLRGELGLWLYYGAGFPAPGESGWPAPQGPYADQWQALMNVIGSDGARGRRLVRAATEILAALEAYAEQRPYLAPGADGLLTAYRLASHGADDVSLADIAPALGSLATDVPVADPRRYEGITGLTTVRSAA